MAGIMPLGDRQRSTAGLLVVEVVSSVLTELVQVPENDGGDQGQAQKTVTKFHGLRAPSISVPNYLQRISKFSGCSDECFILSLIYIDRLITRQKIEMDPLNVHRLIITSIMLAAKFFDDHYLDNAHYSQVGGIPRDEINALELEFLFLIEFDLFVSSKDYDMYHTALGKKAETNGLVSRADLEVWKSASNVRPPSVSVHAAWA